MPEWQGHKPDVRARLYEAAVKQFWSVLEKVAWLINKAFKVGLKPSECHYLRSYNSERMRVHVRPQRAVEALHQGDRPGVGERYAGKAQGVLGPIYGVSFHFLG